MVGVLSTCGREHPHETRETAANGIASLNLRCSPASRGIRCQLLALFRDVSRAPRDVTAEASWRLSGAEGARISPLGLIDAREDGDVDIAACYQSHGVHARVRLRRDHPGQMLATLRGRVYVEVGQELRPVALVRIEILSGPATGTCTMTSGDGSYELAGLIPGDFVIRATKIGYTGADALAAVHPGDNRLSLLIQSMSATAVSAL
jgi:hypothetical protein